MKKLEKFAFLIIRISTSIHNVVTMRNRTLLIFLLPIFLLSAQNRGMTRTAESKFAIMQSADIDAVKWTGGFWKNRYDVFSGTMIPSMWKTLGSAEISHAYRNFEIAASLFSGVHCGPPFHDGDFYKFFEGMASVYAQTRNPDLDKLMDEIIALITKVQREDGYIHTPVIISEINKGIDTHKVKTLQIKTDSVEVAFNDRLNFETYNLGHLMMAGIIHHRATGKKSLLKIAERATDFLCHFYETATAELARNAICPSHYMGVVEMYRETRNPRYLELSKNLIDIRGMVENGTDDNQDRVPFRKQTTAMGHAVRANYLYAGVADVYAETGEKLLLNNLESIWKDIVYRKMYITGACGALYDGTSPDGTHYKPDSIQKVHQSYGRAYQLPNTTAHNETCANIGNVLFNWRMLQVTGDAKYADVLETAMYNSVLSGISLDGKRYFYTNPLRVAADFPYVLRWSKEREEYISYCNCCPPNTVRTLSQVQNYAYSSAQDAIYCNLYGNSEFVTLLSEQSVKLKQTTDYPWDGKIRIDVVETPRRKEYTLYLRIPEWCDKAALKVNGKSVAVASGSNTYFPVKRVWRKGDKIELDLEMRVKLLESNPLVEETRNETAVKRGPIVYCLEGMDVQGGQKMDNVLIPADIKLTPRKLTIDGAEMVVLDGTARLADNVSWKETLYREVRPAKNKVNITLIPYFAWGNRGKSEMTVWMPLAK
jgi:hypothetical protein